MAKRSPYTATFPGFFWAPNLTKLNLSDWFEINFRHVPKNFEGRSFCFNFSDRTQKQNKKWRRRENFCGFDENSFKSAASVERN